MNTKRLFFAFKVLAPWPQEIPKGRTLAEEVRHLTAAFLGQADAESLLKALEGAFPPLPFSIGPIGIFNRCLFLPKRHPHVVAWDIGWLNDPAKLIDFQAQFTQWLKEAGFPPRDMGREWLPHVTIARQPFDEMRWKQSFTPLPVYIGNFCLYESLGHSKYQPIWSNPIRPPFQEIDHTADIAFNIYGESLSKLFLHAQVALAFKFPPLLPYLSLQTIVLSLDELVSNLNALICRTDSDIGCPLKAVSFHGDLEESSPQLLKWEMIVDV